MTESKGEITAMMKHNGMIILELELEPADDTLDALSQVYEWRIGEKVKVIGNEPLDVKYDHTK